MINDIAPDGRAHVGPPVDGRRARAGFWLVAAVYTLVMLGGTLPIPLYAFWAPQMGFGPFTTTLVFAVYTLGTVLALMLFASLSDRGPPFPPGRGDEHRAVPRRPRCRNPSGGTVPVRPEHRRPHRHGDRGAG